jgi:hypothetical protein
MSKQTAIKLRVDVGPDHTIRLPDDVPLGPAEIIVLVPEQPERYEASGGLVGLFADDTQMVDEVMALVHERRKNWRIRPAT